MARSLLAALALLLVTSPAAAQRRPPPVAPGSLEEPQWPLPERLATELRVADAQESSARAAAGLLVLSMVAKEIYGDLITSRQYFAASQGIGRRERLRRNDTCLAHYATSPAFYREVTKRYTPLIWGIPRVELRFNRMEQQPVWAAASLLPPGTKHEWRSEEDAVRLCGPGAGASVRAAGRAGGASGPAGAMPPRGPPPPQGDAPEAPPDQPLPPAPLTAPAKPEPVPAEQARTGPVAAPPAQPKGPTGPKRPTRASGNPQPPPASPQTACGELDLEGAMCSQLKACGWEPESPRLTSCAGMSPRACSHIKGCVGGPPVAPGALPGN